MQAELAFPRADRCERRLGRAGHSGCYGHLDRFSGNWRWSIKRAVTGRIARSVVERCRGVHAEYVFTRHGKPLTKLYNSCWKAARRRAAGCYESEFRRPCPSGFRSVRVHDLKHTFGHRLRAAGVGFEHRKLLLGHKSDHVTTHYSAPEIGALIATSELVCELGSRKSHALTIVRAQVGLATH